MRWQVIISSVATGLVRRRYFWSYRLARAYANRYAPAGSREKGYRIEIVRDDALSAL